MAAIHDGVMSPCNEIYKDLALLQRSANPQQGAIDSLRSKIHGMIEDNTDVYGKVKGAVKTWTTGMLDQLDDIVAKKNTQVVANQVLPPPAAQAPAAQAPLAPPAPSIMENDGVSPVAYDPQDGGGVAPAVNVKPQLSNEDKAIKKRFFEIKKEFAGYVGSGLRRHQLLEIARKINILKAEYPKNENINVMSETLIGTIIDRLDGSIEAQDLFLAAVRGRATHPAAPAAAPADQESKVPNARDVQETSKGGAKKADEMTWLSEMREINKNPRDGSHYQNMARLLKTNPPDLAGLNQGEKWAVETFIGTLDNTIDYLSNSLGMIERVRGKSNRAQSLLLMREIRAHFKNVENVVQKEKAARERDLGAWSNKRSGGSSGPSGTSDRYAKMRDHSAT